MGGGDEAWWNKLIIDRAVRWIDGEGLSVVFLARFDIASC